MVTLVAIYALVGIVAGVLAGLLGIGGGLVIVPILAYLFGRQGVPQEIIMHLALGTSMATIIFTSISSFWAHHQRGAVSWTVVRRIVWGILLGSFLGPVIVAELSSNFLKIFFALFLYGVGGQLLLNRRPQPSRQLPGRVGMFGVGNVIGLISSLVGIGGGTLSVSFMLWCNVAIQRAIGTSAAIGLPIAVAGTLGYVLNGWHNSLLPAHSFGFVYLPALVGIASVTVLTAPLGARLAHNLPVVRLKRLFGLLLLLVATKMIALH